MREYGQIQTCFWTDPDIQALNDQDKLLATYLLTGPHSNGIGCYRLPDGYILADLGWSQETVSKAFRNLSEMVPKGFAYRCMGSFFVVIPSFLKWNPIANANVAAARAKEFDTIPEKFTYYGMLCDSMLKYGKHFGEPFRNRLETLSKQNPTQPYPTQPRTREENNPCASVAKTATDAGVSKIPFSDFWERYPRKTDRTKAEKAWRNLSMTEQKAAIADVGNGRFTNKEKRYIPHPTTYLHGKRWEDEHVAEKPNTGPSHAIRDFPDD